MERGQATVLVIDDDEGMRDTFAAVLRKAQHDVLVAPDAPHGLATLEERSVDVVLLDVQMPGMNGLEALTRIKDRWPDVEVVMISVHKEIHLAVEAVKLGAHDYITKDLLSSTELPARVGKALERRRTARELAYLRDEVGRSAPGDLVLGHSPKMREIAGLVERIARLPATILVTGESGTGKEVLARRVHALSDRATQPFVAVNLAAIPADLLESALFGHERGAFTGAARAQYGKFELANGGTLFLDEIGELAPPLQAKLLRAIQEREVERVGGRRPIAVDLRLIAATNRDLPAMVAKGDFREDLFYRLNVIPIRLPPLRDRFEDVAEFAQHFLLKHATRFKRRPPLLAPEALLALAGYRWPGNIRELENLCERLVAVSDASVIGPAEIPIEFQLPPPGATAGAGPDGLERAVAAFERHFILQALERTGWNRKAASLRLGVAYSTMKKKIKLHGLAPEDDPGDE